MREQEKEIKMSKCGSGHSNFDRRQLRLVLWTIGEVIKFTCENGGGE